MVGEWATNWGVWTTMKMSTMREKKDIERDDAQNERSNGKPLSVPPARRHCAWQSAASKSTRAWLDG